MIITWLGQHCFKIEGRTATVIVDPVTGQSGRAMRHSTDIVVLPTPLSDKERESYKGASLVVDCPGEYESKGLFVECQIAGDKQTLLTRLEVEGMRIGHLGTLTERDEAAENFLEDVDILFVPVGNDGGLGPTIAAAVVSAIEPRIVIPMAYKDVQKFCQALGAKPTEPQSKLSINKKDLPNEETRLIILEA